MLRFFFFLGCISLPLGLSAQNDFRTGQKAWVLAKSGLNVRESAEMSGAKVGKLPYASEVTVLDTRGTKFYVEGIPGDWVKIEQDGMSGFVFDGFLSTFPAPTQSEMYPPLKKWLATFAEKSGPEQTEEKILDEGTEYESTQVITHQDYQDGLRYILEEDDMSMNESVFLPNTSLENAFLLGKRLDDLYLPFSIANLENGSDWREEVKDDEEVQYRDMEAISDEHSQIEELRCNVHILGSYTWMIAIRKPGGVLLEMGSRAD